MEAASLNPGGQAKHGGKGIFAWTLTMSMSTVLATACLSNNLSPGKGSSSKSLDESELTLPNRSTNGGILTLTKVLRSSHDPAKSFDLIGDGSGAMGRLCTSTSLGGTDTNKGPSTCFCAYEFQRGNGASNRFSTDTTYREADLIRCSIEAIPDDVLQVKVKIHVRNADAYSNEVTFDFSSSTSDSGISGKEGFTKIFRYQCRDSIFIPYLLDQKVYDPILSNDPELSYPLNYYVSNPGLAISSYVNSEAAHARDGVGWFCPSVPNDIAAGLDLNVYSVTALNNSKLIYDDRATSDSARLARRKQLQPRSDFWLAREKGGLFTVPVNAYVAPNTNSAILGDSGPTGAPPPLGYGAPPLPSASGKELCPTQSVPGYRWVKVWLFRADLEERKYPGSLAIQQLGSISCNPGNWSDGQPVLPDCAGGTYDTRAIALTNRCYSVTPGGSSVIAKYGDTWLAKNRDLNNPNHCSKSGRLDPMNLCANPTTQAVPVDSRPTMTSLDGGLSRYDYLFVVSPPEIYAEDFKNRTPASLPYTPYRFYSKKDCDAADPDSSCASESHRVISYGVKFHDVSTSGDAPANDPGRLPVFPVCALQKI